MGDRSAALKGLLAEVFALHRKTKNFHWHMSEPHFRDYHLLLDEQASQIFAMTDPIAERARKIGGTTLRSIGSIAREQRVRDVVGLPQPERKSKHDVASDFGDDGVGQRVRIGEGFRHAPLAWMPKSKSVGGI